MRRCDVWNLGADRARRIKTRDTSACGVCVWGWHRARVPSTSADMNERHRPPSGPAARPHYMLLSGLFRLAVTRGLHGPFARGLRRAFGPETAVFRHEG